MSKTSTLGDDSTKHRKGPHRTALHNVAIIALDHVFTARLVAIRKQHTEKRTRYSLKRKKCPVNSRAAMYRPLAGDQTMQTVFVKLSFVVRWDPFRPRALASRAPFWFPLLDRRLRNGHHRLQTAVCLPGHRSIAVHSELANLQCNSVFTFTLTVTCSSLRSFAIPCSV